MNEESYGIKRIHFFSKRSHIVLSLKLQANVDQERDLSSFEYVSYFVIKFQSAIFTVSLELT